MPTITADKISTIAREVLHAAGASEGHARTVGTHLANSNLAGHDSHGFIRIIQYVSNIRQGDIDPKAEPEIERDVGAMAQINGNSTFGQVVAMMASDLAMDKARSPSRAVATAYPSIEKSSSSSMRMASSSSTTRIFSLLMSSPFSCRRPIHVVAISSGSRI